MRILVTVEGEQKLVSEYEFKVSLPSVALPLVITKECIADFGGILLTEVPKPSHAVTQKLVEGWEQVGPEWKQKWNVVNLEPQLAATALSEARERKWLEIVSQRELRTSELGVPVMVNGVLKGFVCDVLNRTRYSQLEKQADKIMANGGTLQSILQANGEGIEYKTMDSSFVPMTVSLIYDIVQAITDQEAAVFKNAEDLGAEMRALPDPTGFDVSQGWPPVYTVPE